MDGLVIFGWSNAMEVKYINSEWKEIKAHADRIFCDGDNNLVLISETKDGISKRVVECVDLNSEPVITGKPQPFYHGFA